MKRVIRSSEYFVPDFSEGEIEEIKRSIKNKLIVKIDDKYGRRFKGMSVDLPVQRFSDSDHVFKTLVEVSNNNKIVGRGEFNFEPYDEYYDESDFDSHMTRSVVDFVDNLI